MYYFNEEGKVGKLLALLAMAMLLVGGHISAGEVQISTINDLVNNSAWDGTNLTLPPNANGYRITGDITTMWNAGGWKHGNVVLDAAGTSLFINDLSNADNVELGSINNDDFILGDGDLYAVGGKDNGGLMRSAINMERFVTLAGKSGNVSAISGEDRGVAIQVRQFIHAGSGTVLAQGGYLSGIYAFDRFETQGNSGDVVAKGAGGFGITVAVGDFLHAGTGKVSAHGATALDSQGLAMFGISVGGNFETSGLAGDVYSEGNLADGMLVAGSFEHRGSGEVVAIGKSGQKINGIDYWGNGIFTAQDFNAYTGSGKVTARGGADDLGWGIYANSAMYIDTGLELSRDGKAESVFVSGTQGIDNVGLTFGANSVLMPVVDFTKSDDLASGLIHLSDGTIKIEDGASLAPILTNTASIANGEERKIRFMEAGNQVTPTAADAKIDGEFTTLVKPTLTFEYELEAVKEKNDAGYDKTYYLKFGRTNTPGGVVTENGYCSDNTRALLNAMEVGLAGLSTPEAAALNLLYDNFAGFTDAAELARYATQLSLTSTPQQFTRLTAFSMRQTDSAQYNLLGNVSDFRRAYFAAVNANSVQPQNWTLWFDPLYHASWSHKAITCGFSKTDEKYGGASLGAAKVIGNLTLGGSAYYLRGMVDASGYDADSDTFGFMLTGRYDFLSNGNTVVPWLQAYAGYGYHDYDQKRRDFNGGWHKSSPDSDVFRAGLSAGIDVAAGANFLISPRIGVDYSFIDQGSYREGNANNLGLRVKAKDYNSFRPYLGIELEGRVTDKFSLTGRAVYRYEAGDRRARLSYNYISAPNVAAKFRGEAVDRSSGSVGIGTKYRISDRASLGANYDLWLEDHYVGHQFGLSFNLDF